MTYEDDGCINEIFLFRQCRFIHERIILCIDNEERNGDFLEEWFAVGLGVVFFRVFETKDFCGGSGG